MKLSPFAALGLALLVTSCSTLEGVTAVFLSSDAIVTRVTGALAAGRYTEAGLWASRLGEPSLKTPWTQAVADHRKAADGLQALETWAEAWPLDEVNTRLQTVLALVRGLPEEIDKAPLEARLNAALTLRDRNLAQSADHLQATADWEGLEALAKELSAMNPPFSDRKKLAELRAVTLQRTARAKQSAEEARGLEGEADAVAGRAASKEKDFDRLGTWGQARVLYTKAIEAWQRALGQGLDSAATDLRRVTGKLQNLQLTAEAEVRAKAAGFYAQLGAVFAREPTGGVPDSWTTADVTAFLQEAQTQITGLLAEARTLANAYPDLLDQGTLAKFDRQAAVFLTRLDTARQALAHPPAPKGESSALPVMVGLFNPQVAHADRSRPAVFRGNTAAKPAWWWGLQDIPKDTFQDLVVTLEDDRKLAVWSQHFGTGSLRPVNDLVSAEKRSGTTWPVLNAGPKFKGGVYHLEIQPGSKPAYQGDVTVYKSFLTRER